MRGLRRSRGRTVETTAVASLSENDGNAAQDDPPIRTNTEELGALEREEPTKLTTRNRALKKLPLLVLYGIACFSLAFVAPYIPHLAAEKHAEQWQFNIMYASTKASMLLGSLVNVVVIQRLTPQATLIVALVGMVACVSLYGSTHWMAEGGSFIGTTIALGLAFGFFYAFFVVTLYAAATFRSQQSCGIIISTMEFAYGISNTVGFIIGTALLERWQDAIPFFISGGLMFLGLPLLLLRSPAKSIKIERDRAEQNSVRLLANAPMIISIVNVGISMAALGFHDGTLEFHLKEGEFRLPDIEVAAVFSVLYISYAFGALFWGYLFTYKLEKESLTVLLGFMIMAAAFIFVGPAPFLPIPPYLWTVYLTQGMTGFGAAAVVVASFSLSLKKAIERGFPANMWTFATVCGFLFAVITLGSSASPLLSRYATDNLRYENAALVMLVTLIILVVVSFGSCISNSRRTRTILRDTTPKGVYSKRNEP
ncbi:uncharacterized protein LOC144152936 isoform X1 [Haemaphysalis longicornis]